MLLTPLNGDLEQLYGVPMVDDIQHPAVGLDHFLPEGGEVNEVICYWNLWSETENVPVLEII